MPAGEPCAVAGMSGEVGEGGMMEMDSFHHCSRLICVDTGEETECCDGALWLAVSGCIALIRTRILASEQVIVIAWVFKMN